MHDVETRAGLWHAAALCLVAGFVDAIGYLELGNVFTANMTGNTVLLGAAVAKGDWAALSYGTTIASFALGVVLVTLLKLMRVVLPAQLIVAAAILVALAIVEPPTLVALCTLAFVMGMQGGAISSFSGVRLPTVVVTSTLVNLIDGLVRRSLGSIAAPPPAASHLQHLGLAWLAYGTGGGVAAAVNGHMTYPLMVPAIVYVVVAAALTADPVVTGALRIWTATTRKS